MKTVTFSAIALFCALLLPVRADDAKKTDKDLDDLAACLIGSFSSEAQSKTSLSYWDIRLHMARIWPDRTDGYWLYVEQARADHQNEPYRQRVYHLHRNSAGELESVVYEFPADPSIYAGTHKDPSKLGSLQPSDLKKRDGCELVLTRVEDGSFKGATKGTGCLSSINGAAYASSEAHIKPEGLDTWDRGYDKDGKQVWGAKEGPYQFRRIVQTAETDGK